MEIGTEGAVASGQYDEEHLRKAGTASKFRKELFRKEFQRIFQ